MPAVRFTTKVPLLGTVTGVVKVTFPVVLFPVITVIAEPFTVPAKALGVITVSAGNIIVMLLVFAVRFPVALTLSVIV
jgi:hypothetical protein